MNQLGFAFGQAFVQAPIILVLLTGLVLLLGPGRRLPGRSRPLALAGVVVLLVDVALSVGWSMSLPLLFRSDLNSGDWGFAVSLVGILLNFLHAAGLGLLLGAVLTRGRWSSTGG